MLVNLYSTIMLKTNSLTIIFDPIAIEAEQCRDVDVIAITHEHRDHFDRRLIGEIAATNSAWILTTPFIARNLSPGQARVVSLRIGDSIVIEGVKFCTEYSSHPGNQPLSFVIKTDNAAFYHPDDSQPFSGMQEIADKHKPDIMLYLANSLVDMVEIAELVKPKTILCVDAPRLEGVVISGVKVDPLEQWQAYLVS